MEQPSATAIRWSASDGDAVSEVEAAGKFSKEKIMNAWKRSTFACLSLLVLGLAPISAAFAQVKVTAATPSSTYQGTISLDVVVSGSGFDKTAKAQYFVTGTTNPGGVTVTQVVFRKSTEIVTTINVADGAVLANFDIQVTLSSGRKGKGTTLFSVKAKPSGPSETPTYPTARHYQGFTSNGGDTPATSRLYMFGGTPGGGTGMNDMWSYSNAGSAGAVWTFIPGGTTTPGPRRSLGWSCGGGRCVAANGTSGTSMLKETWVYSESTSTWSQVACNNRRVLCPSARMGPTTAYDPSRGVHVLFGGDDWTTLLDDTFLFDAIAKTWKQVGGGVTPSARSNAAATFVPGVGVVMSGGWGNPCCVTTLNDIHVWNGTAWAPVASVVVGDFQRDVPTLANHSVAWDAARNALIVTGGFLTSWHTPNEETWYVTFSNTGGAWQATWTLASGIGCQSAASSPPDSVVHQGAMMAFDSVAGAQVFFGGEDPNDVFLAYGNTVECW